MKLFSNTELEYQRKQFYETLLVHGIDGKLYPVSSSNTDAYDFYNDVKKDTAYTEAPMDIKLTFEEVPTIKTLKALGWYDSDENMPSLAYLPVYYEAEDSARTLIPKVDDIVELRAQMIDESWVSTKFQIKDFVGKGFPNTIYWTCKLVRYRESTTT